MSASGVQAIGGFACKLEAYPASAWPADGIFEIYCNRAASNGDPMEVVYYRLKRRMREDIPTGRTAVVGIDAHSRLNLLVFSV